MNKIKKLVFSLVIFSFLLIIPAVVEAKEYTTDYYSVNENDIGFNANGLNFYSVSFRDYAPSFGITGVVYNTSDDYVSFIATAYYYNYNKELIGTTVVNQRVPAMERNSYSQMTNENVLNTNHNVSDIAYFKIKIETSTVNEDGSKASTFGNGEYAITKYKIDIKVNENNTFLITEYITAYFNIEKHGIFRKIPLRNEIVRLDGTKSFNRAKVSDIKVGGDAATKYTENGYRVIKIGNENITLTGSKEYIISYLYNIGRDTGKGYDEFYFNLIGYEWDTTISEIEFTITMPKDFDQSKLGFSSGAKGSTDSSNITYNVDGNVITGTYNGTLKAGEALTVRLELPDGYFVGASSNFDLSMILSLVLPIVFAFLTFILWYKFGRDEKPVETVEFYPLEGFNSAEIGFLYKGRADNNDIVSLLIYLANKGYIKIEETEEKALFSKTKGFKIIKVRDYDGNNANERLFLKGLFEAKPVLKVTSFKEAVSMMKNPQEMVEKATEDSVGEMQEVTSADLYDSFYTTLNAIIASINSKENKEKIFEKNSLNKNVFVILMVIATFIMITFKPVTEYSGFETLIFALLFPGIGFTILITSLTGSFAKSSGALYVNGKPTNSKFVITAFGLIFGLLFGGVPWAFMVLPSLLMDPIYILIYFIGLISIFVMIFFIRYMPKRTPYGNQILGKIIGFRNFLETVEKSKLEMLVIQDPKYFYNILPYTYVLGVSDKWIKKFETIAMQSPDWYGGSSYFDMATFGVFMNSTMKSASSSMSSSPSSDSSSGGGSSGGGSGGGGGGSW